MKLYVETTVPSSYYIVRVNGMLGLATPKIVTPIQLLENNEDN